jgi:L-lactate dehydrogenase (cytochrome)
MIVIILNDFRKLAKKKLPAPIFHYIDGGADDEVTLNRNTDAFNDCDLVPNILNSVGEPDLSTTVFGRKIRYAIVFITNSNAKSYIHQKEIKHLQEQQKNLILCIACLLWHHFQLKKLQIFQVVLNFFNLYVHKDQSITDDLIERCSRANFDGMCLTVDTLVAGNRERDHRTGFTTPPKLTLEV